MRLIILLAFITGSICCQGQQLLHIKITAGENSQPLEASILIKETRSGYATDSSGHVIIAMPANGNYTIVFSAAGYEELKTKISVPYSMDTLYVTLESSEEEMEEVIVQSTRTSRTIANVPTRVETIELEEIDEKANMRPANVAMILHESTGIQVQQTSATSANASIRIQGLDGKYTQLLKDGFPNFGNFSSGLSVLEIPPLDLQQVEIIKGPASPLFGGGAIAGVVNFISRTPKEKGEYNFIINQSNIGQTNIGGFAAQRGKKAGYTLLALYNRQKAYDVDKDDFTEVPRANEFTLHPKLFLYLGGETTITFGNSFTHGKRMGGDIRVVENKADAAHQYFEENKTLRNISTFEFDKRIGDKKRFVIKQSYSVFDREIAIPAYNFAGIDHNAFTDISYVANAKNHAIVAGLTFSSNTFKDSRRHVLDNTSKTGGIYGQHTWDASDKIKLESGLRIDLNNYKNALYSNNETFVLPRISLLIKFNEQVSSRIGGGMGYKTPTLFTEETESMHYANLLQLQNVTSEKSYGGTADVNFRTKLGADLSFSLNHMFFYTVIKNPLLLSPVQPNAYKFINLSNPLSSMGFETNAKFIYKRYFKFFLGYTFTDKQTDDTFDKKLISLVPKGKLNTALIYEKEGVVKLGLEGYFTGKQYLSDGTQAPAFSEFGLWQRKYSKGSLSM